MYKHTNAQLLYYSRQNMSIVFMPISNQRRQISAAFTELSNSTRTTIDADRFRQRTVHGSASGSALKREKRGSAQVRKRMLSRTQAKRLSALDALSEEKLIMIIGRREQSNYRLFPPPNDTFGGGYGLTARETRAIFESIKACRAGRKGDRRMSVYEVVAG